MLVLKHGYGATSMLVLKHGYGATSAVVDFQPWHGHGFQANSAISLHASYAMSGTHIASGCIPLRASYAMSGTHMPNDAISYCYLAIRGVRY
eukprot:3468241-Rhodomonas_salina.1